MFSINYDKHLHVPQQYFGKLAETNCILVATFLFHLSQVFIFQSIDSSALSLTHIYMMELLLQNKDLFLLLQWQLILQALKTWLLCTSLLSQDTIWKVPIWGAVADVLVIAKFFLHEWVSILDGFSMKALCNILWSIKKHRHGGMLHC